MTTPFVADSLAYQFVTLLAVGIFGIAARAPLRLVPVRRVPAAGAAGRRPPWPGPVVTGDCPSSVLGANGAALGLLGAWYVDDRRAAAPRGDDRENDLLGVYVFAAVLLLLPLAVKEASWPPASAARWPARCSG